jgi:F0F1-type ATP synthase delta subunit
MSVSIPHFFSLVCKRYGNSVLRLPEEIKNNLMDDMESFWKWALDRKRLWSFCTALGASVELRKNLIQQFLTSHPCKQESIRFLHLLALRQRLADLPEILSYLRTRQDKKKLYVTSSAELPASQVDWIISYFKEKFGFSVKIIQTINPAMIMGSIFVWDGYIMDCSLDTLLNHIQQRISNEF